MVYRTKYNLIYFVLILFQFWTTIEIIAQEIKYPVILSSRWFHPTSSLDTLSTMKMVELYRPDRIDWMYCTNNEQLAQLRAKGILYSLAINPQVPDSGNCTIQGRIVDIAGNKLVAPWMRSWKQKNLHWGCVNAPEFREVFYTQSRKLIDLGAYGIFVDDARFNDQAVEWGGCYCINCMQGFTTYLQKNGVDSIENGFNYKEFLLQKNLSSIININKNKYLSMAFRKFQRESVLIFLSNWKSEMKTYSKRPLRFLTNNYSGQWTSIYNIFDIGIAELPEDRLEINFIKSRVNESKNLGKQQFFTLSVDDEVKQVKAFLLLYSIGSALVIPWDVYVNSPPKQIPIRFFGKPQIFNPIYELLQLKSSLVKKQSKVNVFQIKKKLTSSPNDSIIISPFNINNNDLLLVQAQKSRKVHTITLKDLNTLNSISILYPYDKTNIHICQKGKSVDLQFLSDVLVLNINNHRN